MAEEGGEFIGDEGYVFGHVIWLLSEICIGAKQCRWRGPGRKAIQATDLRPAARRPLRPDSLYFILSLLSVIGLMVVISRLQIYILISVAALHKIRLLKP